MTDATNPSCIFGRNVNIYKLLAEEIVQMTEIFKAIETMFNAARTSRLHSRIVRPE